MFSSVQTLTLTAPWVLLCLPLPWLVRRVLPAAQPQTEQALRFPNISRVKQLPTQAVARHSRITFGTLLLAWILLVLAASNPVWLGQPIAIARKGRNLMMAIDISPSMRIRDMLSGGHYYPRIEAVRAIASDFVRRRPADRIGLMVFATRPYLETPLTFDHATVVHMLKDASIGLAGNATAIGDAIGLAVKRLAHSEKNVLILLTDGASNTGVLPVRAAADLAAEQHIRIYTIGLNAIARYDSAGFLASIKMPGAINEGNLRYIAQKTGGRYFKATDVQSLERIYHALDQLEPSHASPEFIRPMTPLYPWLLAISLLCLLIARLNQNAAIEVWLRRLGRLSS